MDKISRKRKHLVMLPVCALYFFIGTITVQAATYYVATTGNDSNPGTQTAPFKTIQRAAIVANPGDTVLVRAGTYSESVDIPKSGVSGQPITIKAYPGESPIMDGTNTLWAAFQCNTRSYIVIDGLEIRNYAYGIYLVNNANYCIVRNCNLHHCTTSNLLLRGADYFLVENNEIHHCNTTGSETNWRDTTGNFAEFGVYSHNVVHDNGNFALTSGPDGLAGPGGHNCTWEYNISYNNTDDGIDISSGGGGTNFPNNCIVRYNVCFLNGINPATGLPGTGGGNGIKVSTNAGGGHLVHHNICFKNKRGGFDQDIEPSWNGNSFYNNVAWKNGVYATAPIRGGFLIEGSSTEQGRATLKNNIGFGNDPSTLSGYNSRDDFFTKQMGINVTDYNAWGAYRFVDTDPGHDQEGSHSIIGSNPLFANPDGAINVNYTGTGGPSGKWTFIWNQVQANFALQAGSPCLNAGVSISGITDGFNGSAPDMGAIEN
jgi:hypothetical protein